MRVTEADLLEALQRAMTKPVGEAPTVGELAVGTGQSVPTVRRALRDMQAAGRLEVLRVRRLALDGVERQVPGYRIKAAPKAKRAT